MKTIQTMISLKIEEKKCSAVSKRFRVGPKKVGSVGFPETRQFFCGGALVYRTNMNFARICLQNGIIDDLV